jgi:hypothetical protein
MSESVMAQPTLQERSEDEQVMLKSNGNIEAKTDDTKAVREEKDGGAATQDTKGESSRSISKERSVARPRLSEQ